jgi:hypothetical protein
MALSARRGGGSGAAFIFAVIAAYYETRQFLFRGDSFRIEQTVLAQENFQQAYRQKDGIGT